LRVEIADGVRSVPADAWNALVGDDDPFAEHAFLAALEESGSVGPRTGWQPVPLLVWSDAEDDARVLVGALPLYLKQHSWGEYTFDFAWANAAHRIGIEYYPKLVSMAPMTPATGRRLLFRPGVDKPSITHAMVAGMLEVCERADASSIHLLYLTLEERDLLVETGAFLPRLNLQFHYTRQDETHFDDLLARFRSSARKKVRRERRVVAETNLRIETKAADALTRSDWEALYGFYRDTCMRKGSEPYLTHVFFEQGASLPRAVGVLAYDGDRPVAGSLSFEKGAHLYGRYWGCRQDHEMLHFELCYYRLLERAIEAGQTRFEAGAQGHHKLQRGLLPVGVHSVHHVRDPRLHHAVADYLPREAFGVQREIAMLMEETPFKRG
jgi:hypothetical protein